MARLRLLHCIRAQKSNRIHAMILRWTLVLPFLCLRAIAITSSLEATHVAHNLVNCTLAFAFALAEGWIETGTNLSLSVLLDRVGHSRSSFDQH